MATKKTADVIPLCHPISISHADIVLELDRPQELINCTAAVSSTGKTGVEIEALYAVQVTLLTIYDMCKAHDKSMVMTDITLSFKSGGSKSNL